MPELITSTQNRRIKDAVKLRERRGRDKQRRIIIDGTREISLAIEGGVELAEAFVADRAISDVETQTLLDRLEQNDVPLSRVTADVHGKLAFGQRGEPVIAVARMPRRGLDEICLPNTPLIAVVEGVEKPGNVGAILRTADGAGISAVLVADGGTDLFNPNTIRASLGTVFTVPLCAAPAAEVIRWLREQHVAIVAARVDGAVDYTRADLTGPAAIVLGSETAGLTDVWTGADIQAVKLPMHGHADSLNVSATAAILFYEAVRQRTAEPGL